MNSDATPELIALAEATGGQPPPCRNDPDGWFEDASMAAGLCVERCHVLAECAAYAAAVGPTSGVWAGRCYDQGRAPKRKRVAS